MSLGRRGRPGCVTEIWPFMCVNCRSRVLSRDIELVCHACGATYPLRDGIPVLLETRPADVKKRHGDVL